MSTLWNCYCYRDSSELHRSRGQDSVLEAVYKELFLNRKKSPLSSVPVQLERNRTFASFYIF
jgi:hypothetical protein